MAFPMRGQSPGGGSPKGQHADPVARDKNKKMLLLAMMRKKRKGASKKEEDPDDEDPDEWKGIHY